MTELDYQRVATARESNAAAAEAGLWEALDTTECGHPEIIEAFCKGLPGDCDIVDVGCWNGSIAALASCSMAGSDAAAAPWRSYTAIDCVDAAVEAFRAAHGQRPRTQALQGDVRALPVGDAAADVVLCLFVLQDLEGYRADGDRALAELARIARPGAALLLGLTVQTRAEEETHYVVKKLRRHGIPEKPTHHWFGPDLLAALRAGGFAITALDGFGPNDRGFVELYVRAVRDGAQAVSADVPIGLLPGTPPLTIAYAQQFERVAALFAHDYRDPAAFERAAAAAAARPVPRGELATVLAAQQDVFGGGDAARGNVERLRDGDAVAVVTGQQPALFGGPLYNLLKAATAVSLAQTLEARSGRPHVPVFWIANDDHSLKSLDHVHAVRPDGEVVRIAWEHGREHDTEPVATVRLDAGIARALNALNALGPGDADARALLEDAFRSGELLSDCFGRLLARLFDGLVVVDPSDRRLRRLGMPALAPELAFPSPSTEAAAVATARLAELGFRPQVSLRADRLNLFHGSPQRFRVRAGADGFQIDHGGPLVDGDTLRARFAEAPEEFSPNVLLRPLYQDALFPTAAYVAGPSETAYFAQLAPVYERFGMPMPVVCPRAGATIVDAARAAALRDAGLTVADVLRDVGALGAEPYASDPLHAGLVPLGQPQERVLGAASALLQHGLGLIDALLATARAGGVGHAVIAMDDNRG